MSATEDHNSHASGAVPGLWRTDLQRQDLNVPGREVVQSRVDIGPRWCIRFEGQPPKTFNARDPRPSWPG